MSAEQKLLQVLQLNYNRLNDFLSMSEDWERKSKHENKASLVESIKTTLFVYLISHAETLSHDQVLKDDDLKLLIDKWIEETHYSERVNLNLYKDRT